MRITTKGLVVPNIKFTSKTYQIRKNWYLNTHRNHEKSFTCGMIVSNYFTNKKRKSKIIYWALFYKNYCWYMKRKKTIKRSRDANSAIQMLCVKAFEDI